MINSSIIQTLIVQINGQDYTVIDVFRDAPIEDIEITAKNEPIIKTKLQEKIIKKIIIRNQLVNIICF